MKRESVTAAGMTLLSLSVSAALLWAEFGGIYHAFKGHGNTDGFIAVFVPPYSWYRSVEVFFHKRSDVVGHMNIGGTDVPVYRDSVGGVDVRQIDAEDMAKTPEGRAMLIKDLTLPTKAWQELLAFVAGQRNHEYQSTMNEAGISYGFTVSSGTNDAPTLKIWRSSGDDGYQALLIDRNSDQIPDALRATKLVQGREQTREVSLAGFDELESSKLRIGWAFAWATVFNENKERLSP